MQSNKVNVLKKMLGMIMVAPVVLSLSLFAATPVNHWELDETAGPTYVDSIGGADGNCTLPDGCPTTSTDGQVYGAQSFDGNDTIEVANTANFDWTADSNITIEFWMKTEPDAAVSFGDNDMMIGRTNNFVAWYVAIAPGGFIRAAINNDTGTNFQAVTSPTTVINDGKWNHIAYVLKQGQVRVFVNGEYDFNITRTGATDLIFDTNVTIGNLDYNITPDHWGYTGQLDDIKLYATDLNGSTINEHYQYGLNKPHLEVVTPVPTPDTDTTPAFTFSSDEAGTITYGGSCTSATTDAIDGDNPITFSELSIGTYDDCNITVTIADGNSSVLIVPTFEVTAVADIIAPKLAEVTPVPTPTNDTTPTYTFSSDEAGTITYGGSCTSATTAAVVGNNTITFNALADGTYNCTITVTDAAANESAELAVNEFVVDTTVPDTTVITTGGGGGCTYNPNSKNFDMTFLLMMALGLLYPFRRRFIK